jgi:peptide-methionine (S)-S-oxide reductase
VSRLSIFGWLLSTLLLATPGASTEAPPSQTDADLLAVATFAGGCFWCMEPPFDELEGVVETTSGYTGGHKPDPTYAEVTRGGTGHAEAVRVRYDPGKIAYARLLEVFWRNVDPTTRDRQFCDTGDQYRTAIFYHDPEQKRLAERSKQEIEAGGRLRQPIVTQIVEAREFWPAEEYHQDYYKKNPVRYKLYRHRCGRDQRLEELWSNSDANRRK